MEKFQWQKPHLEKCSERPGEILVGQDVEGQDHAEQARNTEFHRRAYLEREDDGKWASTVASDSSWSTTNFAAPISLGMFNPSRVVLKERMGCLAEHPGVRGSRLMRLGPWLARLGQELLTLTWPI